MNDNHHSIDADSLLELARPRLIEDVIGCRRAKIVAKNMIRRDRYVPGGIFTGEYGSGKTTLARLVAMAIVCLNRAQHDPNPCWACKNCLTRFDSVPIPRRQVFVHNCSNYTAADFAADYRYAQRQLHLPNGDNYIAPSQERDSATGS